MERIKDNKFRKLTKRELKGGGWREVEDTTEYLVDVE